MPSSYIRMKCCGREILHHKNDKANEKERFGHLQANKSCREYFQELGEVKLSKFDIAKRHSYRK